MRSAFCPSLRSESLKYFEAFSKGPPNPKKGAGEGGLSPLNRGGTEGAPQGASVAPPGAQGAPLWGP